MKSRYSSLGAYAVAFVLGLSGLRHVATMQILGRVHMPGAEPLLEGWPVLLIGLGELALGALIAAWGYRRAR